jgi:LacI family transcriptional regulator
MTIDVVCRLHVDPHLPEALAQQIRGQVTWLIAEETLRPGDELPSARTLATHLGVNYHTVRAAYHRLEADGLVEPRRGQRSRVARFDPPRLWPPDTAARTHVVGLVLPSLSNPFYAELVEGAQEAARRSGTLLIVCSTHDDQALALRSIAQLAAKGVDGIVVVSHDISGLLWDPGDGAADASSRLPLVVVDRPGTKGHSIEADLEGAGHLAAGHLIAHGHRALGLISHAATLSNVLPLEAGFRRAVFEAGLDFDEHDVARVDGWDAPAGAHGAARLLARQRRPTGLVAISDLLAIGAVGELRRAGVHVPTEMAVVGVDDIPMAAMFHPPLTTVALPARAMGAESLATLATVWAGTAGAPRRVVLGVELNIRESCGLHAS